MFHIRVEVHEVDIQRSKKMDLTSPKVQKKILQSIDLGIYDAVILTPPCSTFSRAVWANERGPYPLRSFFCPRGFAWNAKARKEKAEVGNILGDFSFEALRRQLRHPRLFAVMEQPENLGRVKRPRVAGHWPGSMWQFHQHEALLQQFPELQTLALAQVDFGAPYVKPTRLLIRTGGPVHKEMYAGLPKFDSEGWYLGPLPRKAGAPLIGHDGENFATSASAAWPPQLCAWVAESILLTFRNSGQGEGEWEDQPKENVNNHGVQLKEQVNNPEEEDVINPTFPPFKGGEGPARECDWKGHRVPFHDGGCLGSPGRWDHECRRSPGGKWHGLRARIRSILVEAAGSEAVLERECFAMAGGEKGCRLVKNEAVLEEVRRAFVEFLGGDRRLAVAADGQPFFLRLMHGLLVEAEDQDCDFLLEAEEGLPLGVLNKLPRTPASFERQVKWALDEDPGQVPMMEKKNYPSAEEHRDHLRSHLESEVEEGLAQRMSREEFKREFGENRAISALAVLVEDEVLGKKRVIHDGSHDVRVNHRIRPLDKIRMPGAREKKYIVQQLRKWRRVAFSLIGDFGKAHRRFKYKRDEQGFLGCVVSEDDEWVYVNKVGTFGITSTPYWWSRISGALLRLAYYLVEPNVILDLLLYADDLEGIAVGKGGRIALVITFVILTALGSPFKWSKQRGGQVTEWIGLTTDYGRYSLGLSERRATWLCSWIRGILATGMVSGREFAGGLGRLSFAAGALPWEKPFLGPLFAWASAVMYQAGQLVVPWAVAIILRWLEMRLAEGGRMEEVREDVEPSEVPPIIWTDAKATEDRAWIGGYLGVSEESRGCPWFSLEVKEDLAPWLKCKKGSPKRVIAALELLATIVAVKLWAPAYKGRMVAKVPAMTDNLSNEYAVKKSMTSKYPGTVLLMELAEELRAQDLGLALKWVRRSGNQWADDLTNEEFGKFDPSLRVQLDPLKISWRVLDKLDSESKKLYDQIQEIKESTKRKNEVVEGRSFPKGKRRKILPKW